MDPAELKSFEGFLAPAFTCFENNEEKTLNLAHIDDYAEWLQRNGAVGVLGQYIPTTVNSITGEGPILGKIERQLNAEAWSIACMKHELKMLIQIGGAPMPDVLDLARHASNLNINGVVCIPELFYKPSDVKQLVGYCKIVAKNCGRHPFFYYHLPHYTDVFLDMPEFCELAERTIPNFAGIEYSHSDLAMAAKCLAPNRIIILSDSRMLSSGLLLGFKTFCMAAFNMVPNTMRDIYGNMKTGQINLAKREQKLLNSSIREHMTRQKKGSWVKAMKHWFNEELKKPENETPFTAGHTRKLH
uniref:N-acetylneuraminate lyase n=1 Tax=Bactrocera latifrons TaxID=174628 RepID=A0A0K8UV87_BACLA